MAASSSSTSTSSLVLFPSANPTSYLDLQLTASLPLPPPVPPSKPSSNPRPNANAGPYTQSLAKRARALSTPSKPIDTDRANHYVKSEDGLLSPPPRFSTRPRPSRIRTTPDPGSKKLGALIESPKPSPSARTTRISPGFDSGYDELVKRREAGNNHGKVKTRMTAFSDSSIDDGLLIQPPRPSLLRPKSFWKSHPRSALTAPAYSPSSQLVRRSTFVAAGLEPDIDSLSRPSSRSGSPSPTSSPRLSPYMDSNLGTALAMAVEGRTSGIICVPGMPDI